MGFSDSSDRGDRICRGRCRRHPPHGGRVRRLLAPKSTVPRALSLLGSGPGAIPAGTPIEYEITVTNNVPISLTGITVFNVLPEGATYVSGADGPPVNNLVTWSRPNLAPDNTLKLKLTVIAARSIINSNYWVTAEEGASAQGTAIVITRIGDTPLPANGDGLSIVNAKATLSWQANSQNSQVQSNAVFNPAFPVFLPLVKK